MSVVKVIQVTTGVEIIKMQSNAIFTKVMRPVGKLNKAACCRLSFLAKHLNSVYTCGTCMPGRGPGSLMLRKLRTSWYVPGTPPSWA